MSYEEVEVRCHYCTAIVKGNQQYMTGGKQVTGRLGHMTNELKAKPEHGWYWNGLSEVIAGKTVSFDFYLCPAHRDSISEAFKWAQDQIDAQKALAELLV